MCTPKTSITSLKVRKVHRDWGQDLQPSNLSGSTLSENPYKGLFGSNGESHESFSAESLSPAAEIWLMKIALVDWRISRPGNRMRSTKNSTEFISTMTDICLYESEYSITPSLGKP